MRQCSGSDVGGCSDHTAGRDGPATVIIVARAHVSDQARASAQSAGYVARVVPPEASGAATEQTQPACALIDAELGRSVVEATVRDVRRAARCPCILLVSHVTGTLIELADRSGADAVLERGQDPHVLPRLIARYSMPLPPAKPVAPQLPEDVVGDSVEMRQLWHLVTVGAASDSSLIITGETGTGKEVVARALHRFSPRRNGPFVALNCAALPETLLESELFGHERGAFTGASQQRKGRFELADGGTLFLDEIGDLPLALQVKLLRVLQERSFERLGGTQSLRVDVRVVAATHRELSEEVKRRRFRADLFYRLNVLSIHVPPLRERRGDALRLWDRFLADVAAQQGRQPPDMSQAVKRIIMRHPWYGNVRELRNAAEHALTIGTGPTVMPADLPGYLTDQGTEQTMAHSLVGFTLQEIERSAILETYGALGTVKETAQTLGISQRKVHYRLKEYRKEGHLLDRGPVRSATATRAPERATLPPLHRRILLAEDDDEVRWALTDLLKSEGYDVVAVSDGRGLLEHLGAAMLLEKRDTPPDLIITDIRMPGISGMQLLESIRSRGWETPVVLISAFGDESTRTRADALGATAFLDKPIDVGKLQHVLRNTALH